jgi:DNA (cytosine-5)-methyltransferase 1
MLTVNELFSGIGAFRKALINLNVPYKIVGISEIDKFAIRSYEAMYGKTRNYGDISKIEKLDYADLWTYGFPCQDISQAGKQAGIVRGKTRSGLLYEVERLLKTSVESNESPKYLIMENVKALVGKKFIEDFNRWICRLNELGYDTYYAIMNAADYGIPQKRERVIAVSIRKDLHKRFEFSSPVPLKFSFYDALEEYPDSKYFLSNEMYKFCIERDQYCKSHNLGYRFTPVARERERVAR